MQSHACFIVFYVPATGVLTNSMKLTEFVNCSQLKSSSKTAWSQQETLSEHLLSSRPGSCFLIDLDYLLYLHHCQLDREINN